MPILQYKLWMRVLDWLMVPLMYIAQGTVKEVPQRTHFWNNIKSPAETTAQTLCLSSSMAVAHDAVGTARERWLWGIIPLFHIPCLGGWRSFLVLETKQTKDWRIGWQLEDGRVGISLVPINGMVRVTLGPHQSVFYAFTPSGDQIDLSVVGKGVIGSAKKFSHVPLL